MFRPKKTLIRPSLHSKVRYNAAQCKIGNIALYWGSNSEFYIRISTVSSAMMTRILRGFPQFFEVDAGIFLDEDVTASLHILPKSSLTNHSTTRF